MAKFAITTKSGRFVTIEAPNFQKAEQEAKRRFGQGCIVDLIGNSCCTCQSNNEIVKNALAHAVAKNAVSNAKFKVGDFVKAKDHFTGSFPAYQGHALGDRAYKVKKVDKDGDVMLEDFMDVWVSERSLVKNAVANAAPMSAHEASVLLSGKRKAVTQYSKVEPNTLYYRALGGIFAVPEGETMKAAIEAIGSRVLPYQVGGVVGNACDK